jgi:hypothetical protein
LIYGNVLKTIHISVSAERVFQAIEAIKYAKAVGARLHTEAQALEMTKFVLI